MSAGSTHRSGSSGHAAFFYEYFLLREIDDKAARMPGYDDVWDSFEIMHRHRWSPGVVPDKRATLDYYTRILDEVQARLEQRELDAYEHYLYRYVIAHQQMHIESLIWARQTFAYPKPSFSGSDLPEATVLGAIAAGDVAVPGGEYFDRDAGGLGEISRPRISVSTTSAQDSVCIWSGSGCQDAGVEPRVC